MPIQIILFDMFTILCMIMQRFDTPPGVEKFGDGFQQQCS